MVQLAAIEMRMTLEDRPSSAIASACNLLLPCFAIIEAVIAQVCASSDVDQESSYITTEPPGYTQNVASPLFPPNGFDALFRAIREAVSATLGFFLILSDLPAWPAAMCEDVRLRHVAHGAVRLCTVWLAEEATLLKELYYQALPIIVSVVDIAEPNARNSLTSMLIPGLVNSWDDVLLRNAWLTEVNVGIEERRTEARGEETAIERNHYSSCDNEEENASVKGKASNGTKQGLKADHTDLLRIECQRVEKSHKLQSLLVSYVASSLYTEPELACAACDILIAILQETESAISSPDHMLNLYSPLLDGGSFVSENLRRGTAISPPLLVRVAFLQVIVLDAMASQKEKQSHERFKIKSAQVLKLLIYAIVSVADHGFETSPEDLELWCKAVDIVLPCIMHLAASYQDLFSLDTELEQSALILLQWLQSSLLYSASRPSTPAASSSANQVYLHAVDIFALLVKLAFPALLPAAHRALQSNESLLHRLLGK